MNINEILDQMSHDITALTFGEKMLGGISCNCFIYGDCIFSSSFINWDNKSYG
jgi:hypothetical protein